MMLRIVLLLALLSPVPARADTDAFALHTEAIELGWQQVEVDVYRATARDEDAVAILAHGFTRERSRHRDLARELAAAGITAVVPDLPYVVNLWGNGDALVTLAQRVEEGALGLPPVARSRIVLVGTSAGGLATVLAAAKLPGLGGWIGLDPVDRTGTGADAASKLTAPAVVFLAEPSGCNLFGSGRSIARAVPRLLRSVTLRGASHCDFEGPTSRLCRLACGGASSEMQALARTETVAAVLEVLREPAGQPPGARRSGGLLPSSTSMLVGRPPRTTSTGTRVPGSS
jgi:dienelactone hydrolase